MVGLLEQHDRQGSRHGGKLVDHSSWQGWASNASPNSRPSFNWGTSVVPIRYKCDGMEGQHVLVLGTLGETLGFGLAAGTACLDNRGAVRRSCSSPSRAQTKHRIAQKVLAVEPLPVVCQLPSFVGSQGIF